MRHDGKQGADVPCCAACQREAHPAGFKNKDQGDGAGRNEEGNPGTKDKPCSPCSH